MASPVAATGFKRTIADEAALFEEVSGLRTVRVPAWRCLAEPEAVCEELSVGGGAGALRS